MSSRKFQVQITTAPMNATQHSCNHPVPCMLFDKDPRAEVWIWTGVFWRRVLKDARRFEVLLFDNGFYTPNLPSVPEEITHLYVIKASPYWGAYATREEESDALGSSEL